MKTFKDFLGEAIGNKYKDKDQWASAAKERGYTVKPAVNASGDSGKKWIAKDSQGNNKGEFESGIGGVLKESELNEAQNQQANFEKALRARDAEIEIVRATHPLAKGKYSIKIYAPSVDKSVVFYADVTQFRGDYMG